ncbi:hypothetical protein H9657_12765 [Cellulomonas sp. Sa3CUA2]|uniref:Solute-binding protein family 5 domain-containing protein n=1 Tax=Cellulomonas avistercoris TaxID=2762242 RepID=A0ABR8QFD2_9CELL|nr:ABC transporter substrate-binding protein [Cellulomonas avistercoris]MBD7919143.1 hypothetical protein [Cellulomonas avistercoris]
MSSKSAKRRNRRIVGGVVAAVVVGGVALAVVNRDDGGGDAQPAAAENITPSARGFLEPPALADRVSAGELPPIDERIPSEPFVVGPGVLLEEEHLDWEDGRYGGTLEFAAMGASGFVNIVGTTVLRSPGQTTEESAPNVVSGFEVDDDYTTFSFTLRDGLRWSDGEPVTTEDVRFTLEDVYGDPEADRPAPSWLYTAGDPSKSLANLEVHDELSFTLTFDESYGQFVADLNSWIPSYAELIKPAHYLKQFHAAHADATELAALVEESGRGDWQTLLDYRDVPHWEVGEPRALGMPTLNAWVLDESGENLTRYVRNPYFWHVDASGHQLPYIDEIVVNRVVDSDALTNAMLAGQVSLASGGEVALNNMPVLKQNAERSGFRVFTTGSFNNPLQLFLNRDYEWTEAGSQWQAVISDPQQRFHRAIAAAIDDEAINDAVYFGLYGDLDPSWRSFDPAQAGALLDELGMTLGSNGMRTYPDGSPFSLGITYPVGSSDVNPVAELLRSQLAEVGIRVELTSLEESLFNQRKETNQVMASLMINDGPGWASGISEDYLPNHKGPWAPEQWQYFLSRGERGRPLEPAMQEFFELHTSRKQVPPQSDEGVRRWEELVGWFKENHAFIPLTGAQVTPTIADVRLRNLPKEGSPVNLDVYIGSPGLWFDQD